MLNQWFIIVGLSLLLLLLLLSLAKWTRSRFGIHERYRTETSMKEETSTRARMKNPHPENLSKLIINMVCTLYNEMCVCAPKMEYY